ncbi:MAG: hypothetical protein GF332_02145 [Candidatus Moranbacteria bacterium]|nr:hypothetical protein [Candidatus Moranbacteria bacterium]
MFITGLARLKKRWILLILGILVFGFLSFVINTSKTKALEDQESTIKIYYKNEYQEFGLIPQTIHDAPRLTFDSDTMKDQIKIRVFKAGARDLLKHLTHDKKHKQTLPKPNKAGMSQLTEFSITAGKKETVDLPIEKIGIYYVEATDGEMEQGVFLLRSGLGVVLKQAEDQLVFWCQDLQTKRSLQGAEIVAYNLLYGRSVVERSMSGNDGIGKILASKDVDIVIVKNGNDYALVPVNLRYINMEHDYNVSNFKAEEPEQAIYIFTDRPIYKPGDKVYYKGFMRQDLDGELWIKSGKVLVEAYLRHGQDKEVVYKQTLEVSEWGAFNHEFKLPKSAKTGNYSLRVTIPDNDDQQRNPLYYYFRNSGLINFEVQYYQKPEYTLEVEALKDKYQADEEVEVDIEGKYFFGQPAANQQVNYEIFAREINTIYYSKDRLKNLSPEDYYKYRSYKNQSIKSGQVNLDQLGKAQIKYKAAELVDDNSLFFVTIQVSTQDQSNNPVVARTTTLVQKGDFVILNQNDQYGWQVDQEKELNFELFSDNQEKVKNVEAQARIVRNWWSYQGEKAENQTEIMQTLTTTSDSQGKFSFKFNHKIPGSYYILITAKDSQDREIKTTYFFWVNGNSNNQDFQKNRDLKLQTVKGEIGSKQDTQIKYAPGQTAIINVSSGMKNQDLLFTTERGFLKDFQIISLDENGSATVEIPVRESYISNMYFCGAGFDEQGLENDCAEIDVENNTKAVSFHVKTDKKEYSVGEQVNMEILALNSDGDPVQAEAAVWSVDKAIYELAEDKQRNILDFFYRHRTNDTNEAHSLQGISIYAAEMGGCFPGYTKVLTANGEEKQIKDIEIGDQVLTRKNLHDSNLVKARIKNKTQVKVDGYININDRLKITPEHYLYLNARWQRADKVKVGDNLLDKDGKEVKVKKIEWRKDKQVFYNLEIEHKHTFFAQNIWVHNNKGGIGMRSVFEDMAYWNPTVRTDKNGKAKISFKLPDNLTTWVLQATGMTKNNEAGQSFKEIVVTQDVIVRPIMPKVLRNEDKIVISALVHNFTQKTHEFRVDFEFDAGEVKQKQTRIILEPNQLKQVYFEVEPKIVKQNAKISIKAQSINNENIGDAIEKEIPVKRFGFIEKISESKKGNAEYSFSFPEDAVNRDSKATVSVFASYLGALPEAMDYLVKYPYGCAEQTTSRFVPIVIAKENPELFAQIHEQKELDKMMDRGLERLAKLQNNRGAWSWWGGDYDDFFLSAYIVEYLVRAEKVGAEVDPMIIERAKKYFESYHDRNFAQKIDEFEFGLDRGDRIAIIYALTKLDSESEFRYTRIDNFNDLPMNYLFMAISANLANGYTDKSSNGIEYLLNRLEVEGDRAYFKETSNWNYGSRAGSNALGLRAMIAGGVDQGLTTKLVRQIMLNKEKGYWYNSFVTAQTIQALVDYYHSQGLDQVETQYRILLNGQVFKTGLIKKYNQTDIFELPVDKNDLDENKIVIEKIDQFNNQTNNQKLFSNFRAELYRTLREPGPKEQNMKIQRRYINFSRPDQPIAVGDTVKVELKVESQTPINFTIIKDELPSGMVFVNRELDNEPDNMDPPSRNYSQARETISGAELPIRWWRSDSNYYYFARAVNAGDFFAPPALVEAMYDPDYFAQSKVQQIKIDQALADPEKQDETGFTTIYGQDRIGNKASGVLVLVILVIISVLLSTGMVLVLILQKRYNILGKLKNKMKTWPARTNRSRQKDQQDEKQD